MSSPKARSSEVRTSYGFLSGPGSDPSCANREAGEQALELARKKFDAGDEAGRGRGTEDG